jgi:hypothetical protein
MGVIAGCGEKAPSNGKADAYSPEELTNRWNLADAAAKKANLVIHTSDFEHYTVRTANKTGLWATNLAQAVSLQPDPGRDCVIVILPETGPSDASTLESTRSIYRELRRVGFKEVHSQCNAFRRYWEFFPGGYPRRDEQTGWYY